MALKAIKISEENYKSLVKLSASLQNQSGEMVSIDKAINHLLQNKEKKVKVETKQENIPNPDHHRHYVG